MKSIIEPTQEQIKEFWEWCGLVHISNPIKEVANSCEAMAMDTPLNGWYKPDYSKGSSELVSLREVPKIDLNNLFKYACEDDWEIHFYFDKSAQDYNCIITVPNEREFEGAGNTYALALFRALKEMRYGKA